MLSADHSNIDGPPLAVKCVRKFGSALGEVTRARAHMFDSTVAHAITKINIRQCLPFLGRTTGKLVWQCDHSWWDLDYAYDPEMKQQSSQWPRKEDQSQRKHIRRSQNWRYLPSHFFTSMAWSTRKCWSNLSTCTYQKMTTAHRRMVEVAPQQCASACRGTCGKPSCLKRHPCHPFLQPWPCPMCFLSQPLTEQRAERAVFCQTKCDSLHCTSDLKEASCEWLWTSIPGLENLLEQVCRIRRGGLF